MPDGPARLEDQLELSIMTYNRASELDKTLAQLAGSPFADCRIRVVDNHSSDATPEVCARWAERLTAFEHVRNRFNIGLGANLLRAFELSTTPYTWVLGDDDVWDFSDCEDVLETIRTGSADLIGVGAPGQEPWERGLRTTVGELVRMGSRFFSTFTFAPNTIFRTELLDSAVLSSGYRNADTLYPQFPLLERALREDRSVYLSRSELVVREGTGELPGELYWLAGWARATSRLQDRGLRARVGFETRPTRWAWFKWLGLAVMVERLERPAQVRRRLLAMWTDSEREQRRLLALVAPLALMPPGPLHAILRLQARVRGFEPPAVARPGTAFDDLRL